MGELFFILFIIIISPPLLASDFWHTYFRLGYRAKKLDYLIAGVCWFLFTLINWHMHFLFIFDLISILIFDIFWCLLYAIYSHQFLITHSRAVMPSATLLITHSDDDTDATIYFQHTRNVQRTPLRFLDILIKYFIDYALLFDISDLLFIFQPFASRTVLTLLSLHFFHGVIWFERFASRSLSNVYTFRFHSLLWLRYISRSQHRPWGARLQQYSSQ